MSRHHLVLLPALLGCLMGCGDENAVDPPGTPPGNPPGNPPDGQAGFSVLTLLHGSRSGAFEQVRDVAVDAQGNVYVTGGTADPGFPTTPNAYQRTFGQGQSATSTGSSGNWDVFVMKFTPDGLLAWSTLLGGGNYDRAYGIEVDASGVYVAGRAGAGFPTTGGVIQQSFAGDNSPNALYGRQDGFMAKVSPDGSSLLWATYLGSGRDDFLRDIAVGANGDLYPAVSIAKASYPYITSGAYQVNNRGGADGVVCRISADATTVRWCTYIGGSGSDGAAPTIRLDGAGNVYYVQATNSTNAPVTPGVFQPDAGGGGDQHLSKFSPQGALLYATYFGGSGSEGGETHNLWVTTSGEAYIAAGTSSTNLPTTDGALRSSRSGTFDGFIARISADGRELLALTYLGGSAADEVEGVGFDGNGNVVVTGATSSDDFPGLAGAPQATNAGSYDGFIAVLPPSLGSVRASLVGGGGADNARTVAVDRTRNVAYTGGATVSPDFPTLVSAFLRQFAGGEDAFLAGWRLP